MAKVGMEMLPGCEILEKNIQADHIHVVMIIPPKYAVSDVMGRIKGVAWFVGGDTARPALGDLQAVEAGFVG